MFFYLFLIVLSTFLFHNSIKNYQGTLRDKCSIVFALLPLILIEGLRDTSVGRDCNSYFSMQYEFSRSLKSVLDLRFLQDYMHSKDYAYYFVHYISSRIFDDVHTSLLLFAVIKLILVVYSFLLLRKELNPTFAFLLYLLFFYVHGFNFIRQTPAISLSYLVFAFCIKGDIGKSIFLAIIAYTFHSSAICLFPLIGSLYLYKLRIPKWVYVAGGIMIYFFAMPIMFYMDSIGLMREGMADTYFDTGGKITIGYLLPGIAGIFTYMCNKKEMLEERLDSALLLSLVLNIICVLSAQYFLIAFRMAFYPYVLSTVVSLMLVNKTENLFLKKVSIFLIFLSNLLVFIGSALNGYADAIPYNSHLLDLINI